MKTVFEHTFFIYVGIVKLRGVGERKGGGSVAPELGLKYLS